MVNQVNTKYEQVIWDWNGTLLNDTPAIHQIINQILIDRGVDAVELSFLQEKIDFPVSNFYQDLGLIKSEKDIFDINHTFHSEYAKVVPVQPLHRQAKSIIKELYKTGVSQFILSAHEEEMLRNDIERLELTDFFNAIRGSKKHKSYLGKLSYAQGLINPKKSAVMIGDTTHDAEIADALGIDCILMPLGINNKDRLKSSSALIVNNHQELKEVLL